MSPAICPRRILERGPWSPAPEPTDHWRDQGSFGNADMRPTCSHCGSLHPDVFMAKVREGWKVGGTDKNYKWYLDRPFSEEEQARSRERFMASSIGLALIDVGGQEAADAHYARMLTDGLHEAVQVAKFYTPHLSRAQAEEIMAMWTAETLRHSMYVRPWFPALDPDAPDWLIAGAG